MGVLSTQGIQFQLVANDIILDLFKDEDILLSDNVTGLFDLGVIPADFTRQITLPGTKKNNAFFEHVYDISIQSPDTFATNIKVPCYLDFGGVYLSQGYLQLNQVNIFENKFIDSYEVTIFGAISSFAREINRSFLTDLNSLSIYNHTASYQNITGSWENKLFSGSIVYPFAEYGQKIEFTPEEAEFGIDAESDGMCVQDYKPAIKAKLVWDAIFNEAGYNYSSSFIDNGGLDNIYLLCNRSLRYPLFSEANLETFGLFKIQPISGSGQTNWQPSAGSDHPLPWYNVTKNTGGQMGGNLIYSLPYSSSLRGNINLNVEISGSANAGGLGKVPNFTLRIKNVDTNTFTDVTLNSINNYFLEVQEYNGNDGTKRQKTEVGQKWNSPLLGSGSYEFDIKWLKTNDGNGDVVITLEPDNQIKSYLEVTKVAQLGDGWVMNIPANMPFGTNGIKQIDFLTSIQKKFNLVMYPSKVVRNQMVVEPFNSWYKSGRRWDFNKYINLNDKIEIIPANNLAVNELNFGDLLDQDYISQQFSKEANREYGKQYYVDTENFFSQGTLNVKTSVASTPLLQLANTGVSGSVSGLNPGGGGNVTVFYLGGGFRISPYGETAACRSFTFTELYSTTGDLSNGSILYYDANGSQLVTGIITLVDPNCDIYEVNAATGEIVQYTGITCVSVPRGICL
jgi:hypothetical protein